MNVFEKMKRAVDVAETCFLSCSLGLMVLLLAVQVIWRYFLNSPLVWTEELARYVFLWITFLGISYGLRKNAHIAVEMLVDSLPARLRKPIILFDYLVFLALLLYLLGPACNFCYKMWNIASPGMGLSMGIVYLALPLGFVLACVRILFRIFDLFAARKEVSGS